MSIAFTPRFYGPTIITITREELDAMDYKWWAIRSRLKSAGLSKAQCQKYEGHIRGHRILKATGIEDAIDTLNAILKGAMSA